MSKLQRDFYIIFQPTFIFVIIEYLQSDKEESIYSGPEMDGMRDQRRIKGLSQDSGEGFNYNSL